ncbi:acetyltransferase [Georgenia muralis]|uniref:Sugar O-acyltransferase (Sialic acid O-acetyltransferase NeuD family) n=1 Tax=Georgenia muralis TaxID=154117 RepID=A0A3N4ZJT0_9MICO|nr:acetyltransferase [Georgenia muralis]RPF26088.1 sugar O-acyltransferase (sialic acid O-acetyltransferase NeuD family) [Georgenia muralis]
MRSRPDLLLVAASGLAREVIALVRSSGSHELVGVLDDDPATHGTELDGVPVLGGPAEVDRHPGAMLVLCAGRGVVRRSLADRLASAGVQDSRYAVVKHPSVDVPPGCTIGAGSVVLAQVAITADVRVGRHVVLMPNASLTHDDVLDDFATVCAGASLGGSVTVREGAYVGMNVCLREHVEIGPGATIGMGAVVLGDVPAGQVWAGVPAGPLTSGAPGPDPSGAGRTVREGARR